jgi:hypothetical protein
MTDDTPADPRARNAINRDDASPAEQSAHNSEQSSGGKAFSAFGYRNYRLWFVGQSASLIGTWMQSTAQGFLVFELTHSPAYLGYVGFAAGMERILLACENENSFSLPEEKIDWQRLPELPECMKA